MVAQGDYIFKPTLRQAQAFDALCSPTDGEVLYGGAKGGGKSYFGCHWCLAQCLRIIEHCEITTNPEFPIPVGFMGRKIGKDFKDTTLETWKKTIPSELYEIKGQPAEIIIDGKVKILTGGLDNSAVVNKFNSAEYFFAFIDQAEETEKDDISVLRGSLRGKINDKHIPYQILWTANPAQCWLKNEFIDTTEPYYTYVPALPTDNPHLPEGYIDTLKKAFGHRPELLEGYLNGSWDCFEGADQVIKNLWITASRQITLNPVETRRFIVCDPARFGDDETTIYRYENTLIKEEIIYGQKDTHYTSGKLNQLSLDNGDITIIIDGDGLGGPIIDNLSAYGRTVIEHRGSGKAFDSEKYHNVRAECWDKTAQMFSDRDIEFKSDDPKLVAQLCTPRYKFRNGKILIEPKADIKKRTGESPDRADNFTMAMYHLDEIEPSCEDRQLQSSSSGVPDHLRRY